MSRTPFRNLLSGVFGRGPYPHELAFLIDNPARKLVNSSAKHAERLGLKPTDCVLEIGPGSGYFSVEVIKRIPQGELVLFDLQQEMLDKAARKLARLGFHNFKTVQGDASSLPFGAGEFDVVFIAAVFGEIPDRAGCLAGCHAALKQGGRLSISEHVPDPDFQPLDRVRQEAQKAGFEDEESFGMRWSFTVNFRRP